MIYIALVIAAIAEIQDRGQNLAAWAAILLGIALLYAKL